MAIERGPGYLAYSDGRIVVTSKATLMPFRSEEFRLTSPPPICLVLEGRGPKQNKKHIQYIRVQAG